MLDYAKMILISRGSFLVYNRIGALPDPKLKELFRNITIDTDTSVLQEIWYNARKNECVAEWRKVRQIPQNDNWFENVWHDFRNGDIFK